MAVAGGREPSDRHRNGDGQQVWLPAVGGVLVVDGAIALVRRGNAPARGLWSLPGGRVEADEDPAAAVVREMAEETGMMVVVRHLLDVIQIPAAVPLRPGDPDECVAGYAIHEFLLAPAGPLGGLRASSDAIDAGWFTQPQLTTLDTTAGLREHLRRWQVWG